MMTVLVCYTIKAVNSDSFDEFSLLPDMFLFWCFQ